MIMKKTLALILTLVLLIGVMLPTVSAAEPLAQNGLTLDSIAWENLTYRNIFVDRNLAYVNGFDDNNWRSFIQNTGNNSITGAVCFSSPYSLKAAGTSSQQIMSTDHYQTGDYFVASKVYCTRYVRGKLGVCIGSNTIGVSSQTNGFVTSAGILTNYQMNRIYIGSIHSANLDGYVDDPVVIRMDIFSTRPTEAELTALYEQYLALKTGTEPPAVYTDQQMVDAFVDYMQEKAQEIGMEDSVFADPVGDYCNTTTARDVMKLILYADTYEQISDIWSRSSRELTVRGSNARKQTVYSKVMKASLTNYYRVLGGKSGTLSCCINLAVILEIPGSEDRLAVVAMNADASDGYNGNRYQAVKQIADAALMKYDDPEADLSEVEVCCGSAMACLLPADGSKPTVLYSKDPDTQRHPASLTKVLNAICALEIIGDLKADISYKQFDINVCPWYYYDFYSGDTMTLEDTLSALLLPSSNVTAFTLARVAGEKLLRHIHSYTAQVTAPTCTQQGYTTHTCSCGDSYVDTWTEPTGHSWGHWQVIKAPTYSEPGLRQRTCAQCGWTEQEETARLELRYGDTNGDGRVSSLDLILLRQYIAGWDVSPDLLAADVNGNGSVNALDLILLRQYIAGWDVILGPQEP